MEDRKRKHAHQGDKPKAKRQTRSMAHPAVLGSVSSDRDMSKAPQSKWKGKSVLKRSKSGVHDSAPNEYKSDSEVYVSVSDSSDEYVPQEVDDASRSSRVPSKKCEEQERSWGTKDSSNRSSGDSAVHQIKSSSRYDMECDTNANPTTSSRRPLSNKSRRTADSNHSNKSNRNSSSSGRKNLSSSSRSKTAKLAKSKARKYVKTCMNPAFQNATVPSSMGCSTATHMPSRKKEPIFQSRLPPVSGTLRLQTFERVMNSTWKPPSTYTEIANIRNRATFSLRHHMLLHEGYLRQSDLVNCFADMHPVPSSGALQHVVGLALSLQYGKKVPTAKTEIAMVLRHKDFRRCPVGSLALYLFSRFHTQCEELPDFTDPDVWPKNKLLRSSTSTQAVQRELQSNLCAKLSRDLGIDTNTIQQIGRLSGAEELGTLDLNFNFPARIGPNGFDIPGTVAMAGFHNTQYDIERDRVIPFKTLQRRIFPGIEEQYGWMAPEEWKAHCDRVMMSPTGFLGLEGSRGTEMKRRLDAVQESEEAYQDVAKLQLMHLLLWLRRVVLQDAALFKRDRFSPWVVKDPIFHSAEFNQFQAELLAKMGSDGGANLTAAREQEDSPISDSPSTGASSEHSDHDTADELSCHDTNSELFDRILASSSTDSDDARSETLDEEVVMKQQIQSDHAQLHVQIRQLQERLDQQEQRRQQQEQCLQNQTTLLRNVLEQQSSLESQMKTIQTQVQNQIHTMQTELTARQDSQFNSLAILLRGIINTRSPPTNSPVVSNDTHIKESTNASTPSIIKEINDLAVVTAPTSAQEFSAAGGKEELPQLH